MAGDEFAGLLRELKERSGLSYGALAKRLHVSTSTLHRYVNGDAVPADYAPVERLARACRATPDELVELHRRWVLADALRGRKGPGPDTASAAGSPAGGGAGPEAAPTGAKAPGAGSGPGAAEAAVGPETGAEGASGRPSDGGADGPAEGGRSAGGEAPGPAPVRRSRPRNRRTVVLAAVGAVVATAVVAGTLAVRLGSGSGDDDAEGEAVSLGLPTATGPRETGGTPDARHGSASVSASASRGAGPETSVPSVGGSVDRGGAAADRAVGEGAAGDGAGAPAVAVDPYRFEDPCSQHYLVDRPAPQVPPPPNESDARGWVTALGGVASGEQMLALTVQGTGKATVVLKALHVRVLGKSAPLAWNDYAMGVGCGGGVETKSFTVDLDAGRPAIAVKGGQRNFPYKVSESDPEVFYVFADAQAHNVRWCLELDWSSGTKSGTVRVDDHGKPFRTSGNVGRPAYDYPLGDSEWRTAPPPG
ncbi:helix-turn-helix domain-containing protein [Streptomyces sp. NBC_00647]|uniref:helix-turn-helix domain-containing protein n=1 Tax=Streptomyces sp. NBC_00647 TaxID=2975796 RepID=UPI00325594BE